MKNKEYLFTTEIISLSLINANLLIYYSKDNYEFIKEMTKGSMQIDNKQLLSFKFHNYTSLLFKKYQHLDITYKFYKLTI